MTSRFVCLGVALLAASGCAPFNTPSSKSSQLSQSRLPPDAVVLDVAFVRLPVVNQPTYDIIWQAADEQQIPAEVRAALGTNGLRVGVLGQQLPSQLRDLLDARPGSFESLSDGASADLEIGGSRQHLPVRSGHRSIIKCSKVHTSLPLLLSEDGHVHGYQLRDARCILSLKPYPLGDGRVKLSLTPELEHGESKARYTGGEGMMMVQTDQERLALDRLRLEAVLSPGQSLILSTTREIKGLGECFFSQMVAGAAERRLLIIRFTQTQFDDLFVPEQVSAPLTTPAE